jgi:hypothetical protein
VLLFGRWAVLVFVTELLVVALAGPDSPASELLLLRATLILVLGIHTLPRPGLDASFDPGELMLWSLLCGAALPAGAVLAGGGNYHVLQLMPLAGGCALLVLMFCTVSWRLAQWLDDRRLASRICTTGLLLSLSLPLWAAPLALYGIGDFGLDAIIALCPLSYLATLAEIDYLRGDWWYRHMPYGGLRYNYADPLLLSLAMVSSIAVVAALGKFQWRWAGPRPIQH